MTGGDVYREVALRCILFCPHIHTEPDLLKPKLIIECNKPHKNLIKKKLLSFRMNFLFKNKARQKMGPRTINSLLGKIRGWGAKRCPAIPIVEAQMLLMPVVSRRESWCQAGFWLPSVPHGLRH